MTVPIQHVELESPEPHDPTRTNNSGRNKHSPHATDRCWCTYHPICSNNDSVT